ncbi:TetR/AcrR family transcriptional regulator [Thermoactinomyces sp. CICC 10521]|uniref:TetR/AcrR family transcriptional regulator n=1 Tax=Thermoactinomyces sp. CICC 10521 TaxID=2767426 RepID=UPI0018DB2E74|nr:TetR/AcrR family transcriptional regulator [Thermoactinomyces sp. CICC 10521]MBH8608838.1 TetR/AcrR family transcriptional regulator [Thermoactinomyces sp. CICC 10521]
MSKSVQKEGMTSRDLQAAKRRKQLLQTAKKLFAEKGYHNTSTKEINRAIGMADGLIYHYFSKGKLEILHTIVQDSTEGKIQHLEKALKNMDADMPIRDMLLKIAHIIVDNADNELIVILIREQPLLTDEQTEWLTRTFDTVIGQLSVLLEKRMLKGELRRLNCKLMARQFVSSIQSYLIEQTILGGGKHRDQTESDKHLMELIDFLLECWR